MAVLDDYYVYLFGGRMGQVASSDLWVYSASKVGPAGLCLTTAHDTTRTTACAHSRHVSRDRARS
jgi:hypothetical protein